MERWLVFLEIIGKWGDLPGSGGSSHHAGGVLSKQPSRVSSPKHHAGGVVRPRVIRKAPRRGRGDVAAMQNSDTTGGRGGGGSEFPKRSSPRGDVLTVLPCRRQSSHSRKQQAE
ncbi:hypothetical protein HN51_011885, partial [Arachis hypogaea]